MSIAKNTYEIASTSKPDILTNDRSQKTDDVNLCPELCTNKPCTSGKRYYSADRINSRYKRRNGERRYRPQKVYSPFEDDALQYEHLNFGSLKNVSVLNYSLESAKQFCHYLMYSPLGTSYEKLCAQFPKTDRAALTKPFKEKGSPNQRRKKTETVSSPNLKIHNSPEKFRIIYQADESKLSSDSLKLTKSDIYKQTTTASSLNQTGSKQSFGSLKLPDSDRPASPQGTKRISSSFTSGRKPVCISVNASKRRNHTPKIDISSAHRATANVQGSNDWGQNTSGEALAMWVDTSDKHKNKKPKKFIYPELDR